MFLKCILIHSAPSSYTNFWWRDALEKSVEVYGDHKLRKLTEVELGVDVVCPISNRFIDFPVLRDGQKFEDGFYHLSLKTTSKMLVGFMHIKGNSAIWWGQGTGDSICAGMAGDQDGCRELIDEKQEQIFNWIGATTYTDQFPDAQSINDILKM